MKGQILVFIVGGVQAAESFESGYIVYEGDAIVIKNTEGYVVGIFPLRHYYAIKREVNS